MSLVKYRQSATNRSLHEEVVSNPHVHHNPNLIDGEGHELSKKTSTIFDPMEAAVYASIPTPVDKEYYAKMLDKGGVTLCLQDKMADNARVNI